MGSFSKQTSENFRQSKISRIKTDKFSSRMAPLRFSIPLQRKDLLRGASDGQYWVENEYSIRELKTKLVDTQVMVNQRGSQFILDGGFDVIFSVLELFHKDLPHEFKAQAFECLEEGLDHLIRNIDVFAGSSDLGNDREKLDLANKMKMIVYLLCQLVELIEADVLQKESATAATTTAKNKKNKKILDDSTWNWDEKRFSMLAMLWRL